MNETETSRRRFLQTSVALAVPAIGSAASVPVLAYVGSYSSPQGPEGSKGHGQGIYLFEMDPATGSLTRRDLFPNDSNPSWLALHPSGKFLYAAEEISNFAGTQSGAVSAYSIARPSGRLAKLNTVTSQGTGPAHLSVHPSGKFALVANYYGGTFAVLPIRPDGTLAPATDVQRDTGATGPSQARSAPPGSFAISGHDHTHAHMIESDPGGKFVLGTDLGTDQIHIWKFNPEIGRLDPNGATLTPVPTGDGPRHFVFHPNGRWLYCLQEEGSTVILFDYNANVGSLTQRQQLSTLPAGFTGTNFTSEVRVSADGKFLYVANRLHDSIAFFSIDPSGRLTLRGETWTRGDYPRSFTIDPSGSFLYSCNQRSDAITAFRVNRENGDLTFTGQYTALGTPSIIVFLNSRS